MESSLRIWRDIGSYVCATLLVAAFVTSTWLLVQELFVAEERTTATVAELLLVAVLSLEGVIAVFHLTQARSDAQVESLKS